MVERDADRRQRSPGSSPPRSAARVLGGTQPQSIYVAGSLVLAGMAQGVPDVVLREDSAHGGMTLEVGGRTRTKV